MYLSHMAIDTSLIHYFRNWHLLIALGGIGIGLAICLSQFLFASTHHEISPIISQVEKTSPVTETKASADLLVDIAGGVKKPGLYTITTSSRISDVVIKAGGFSSKANTIYIAHQLNLAEKVTDGQKIYIPLIGEDFDQKTNGQLTSALLISINHSQETEFETLTGVGPKRAADIVAGRPYQRLEELVEKKIIPASVFSEIKKFITL